MFGAMTESPANRGAARPLAWLALSLGAEPFGLRLIGAALLTVFSIVLLVLQVRAFGFALGVRFMIDALFLSIGLVFLGQALFSEKT